MALILIDTDDFLSLEKQFARRSPGQESGPRYWWRLQQVATVEDLQQRVAYFFDMPRCKMQRVNGSTDGNQYTLPRYVGMYLANKYGLAPKNKIALYFGLDRSMIYFAIEKVRQVLGDPYDPMGKRIKELEELVITKMKENECDRIDNS